MIIISTCSMLYVPNQCAAGNYVHFCPLEKLEKMLNFKILFFVVVNHEYSTLLMAVQLLTKYF